ncbi:MAG: sigma 54-interacting transcriptional regulator, partial [Syntrophales bacterium]
TAGAEIELARTRIALGNYHLKKGETKVAQSYLAKAWSFFSKVDKSLFPPDLLAMMPKEQKLEFLITRIANIAESFGTLRDASSFLERVINMTIDFTMAMRGGFLVIESGEPKIIASRNIDTTFLNTEGFRTIQRIILDASREGIEAIIPGADGKEFPRDKILQKAGIDSLICMPAKLDGRIYGYLCLSNRLGGRPFHEEDLPFLRIISSQIAVCLSNIHMYNEMKELKDRFKEEADFYKQELGGSSSLKMIVGQSPVIQNVMDNIRQVAPTASSVLILGETGVGKELVAKAVHELSKRKDGPFIPINLATLPQELVTSELFGHEKGSFTGANERQKGRFELANGGTIFLDEIGDLPPAVQVKLLRVLQEGSFERLGSAKQIHSDFRVIAATNKNLQAEVEKGAFRQDLFFRLNAFAIDVPPLRARKEDIPRLAQHFLDRYNKEMGKRIRRLPANEIKRLLAYHWPGNIRELKHLIERAVILSDGHGINFADLERSPAPNVSELDYGTMTMADMERSHITKILNLTGWKVGGQNGAAAILGLTRQTLFFRMKKLGVAR